MHAPIVLTKVSLTYSSTEDRIRMTGQIGESVTAGFLADAADLPETGSGRGYSRGKGVGRADGVGQGTGALIQAKCSDGEKTACRSGGPP